MTTLVLLFILNSFNAAQSTTASAETTSSSNNIDTALQLGPR